MAPPSLAYRAFVVRQWREAEGGPEAQFWLIQVEVLPSGETHYFVTPETLVAYLLEHLAGEQAEPTRHGEAV